nr:hypothetical protein HmN_000350700 [Hymenolepis microstoma]
MVIKISTVAYPNSEISRYSFSKLEQLANAEDDSLHMFGTPFVKPKFKERVLSSFPSASVNQKNAWAKALSGPTGKTCEIIVPTSAIGEVDLFVGFSSQMLLDSQQTAAKGNCSQTNKRRRSTSLLGFNSWDTQYPPF